jgi:hypothetical protein
LPTTPLPSIDIEITDPIEDIPLDAIEATVSPRRIREAELVIVDEVEDLDSDDAEEAEAPRPRRGRPPALRRPVEPRPELIVEENVLNDDEDDDEGNLDDETGDDSTQPSPNASAAALAKRRRGRPPKRSNKPIRPNPSIQPVLDEAPPAKRGRKPAVEEDED